MDVKSNLLSLAQASEGIVVPEWVEKLDIEWE